MPPEDAPRIYLDHNATTPLDAEARAAMLPFLEGTFGNPSSVHRAGRVARHAVEEARAAVAALAGARLEEVIFVSGGTEADNLALRAGLQAARSHGRAPHLVLSPLEHPAVRECAAALAREGALVTELPVDAHGRLDPDDLRRALRPDTALVSIQAANHEIGNVYPVAELCAIARERGALFHCDAVQAAGKMPLDAGAARPDLVSLSAHKLYGPKGVGALCARRDLGLAPILAGGHQERGRRPGTENVAGIVGFGVAAAVALRRWEADAARVAALRDRLERALLALPGARLNGDPDPAGRVPGTLNVGFDGAEGALVAVNLDLAGVCVSTGAACSSGSLEPSPVLLALGCTRREAASSVRFSLGRDTTAAEVDEVAAMLPAILERVRSLAPVA
ncbi:MAG: cysteine desulfurase [Deltaproteobacteria bacterium]|nr:cysteine desulfurase [Deltaproteobacteria bacterium]